MFRYDAITGKPAEVVFIDLQMSQEGDSFRDLNYTLYVNTTQELRKKHFTSLLHRYYDKFEEICHRLNAPLPPGWSWEEFYRRFHRAQIIGAFSAAVALPMVLQNPAEVKDMEKLDLAKSGADDTDDDIKNVWSQKINVNIVNPIMEKRFRGALEDGVAHGII